MIFFVLLTRANKKNHFCSDPIKIFFHGFELSVSSFIIFFWKLPCIFCFCFLLLFVWFVCLRVYPPSPYLGNSFLLFLSFRKSLSSITEKKLSRNRFQREKEATQSCSLLLPALALWMCCVSRFSVIDVFACSISVFIWHLDPVLKRILFLQIVGEFYK